MEKKKNKIGKCKIRETVVCFEFIVYYYIFFFFLVIFFFGCCDEIINKIRQEDIEMINNCPPQS